MHARIVVMAPAGPVAPQPRNANRWGVEQEETAMKKIEWSVFILLLIGTLGLLMNEFIFSWGRPATLAFAAANVVGLVALAFSFRRGNRR
jgi:hypothetical protein